MLSIQVKVNVADRLLELTLRKRKGCVDGKPQDNGGRFLFTNKKCKAVSREAWRQTFAQLGGYCNGKNPVPHSARMTGARYWIRAGLSLETVAGPGARKDLQTLTYYLGAAPITRGMRQGLDNTIGPHGQGENWE